jgi:hypothetical protein
MGLDSYFILNNGIATDLEWPEVKLCGGMLSGHGDGSFRGKVYDRIFVEITAKSLYEEEANNDWVFEAAQDLEIWEDRNTHLPDDYIVDLEWETTAREVRDLARMFRFAAEAGCSYHGWW